MSERRDQGFGLVAAVAAVAAFAYIAFQILAVNRGTLAGGNAQFETAKLAEAADAGVALALHGLAITDAGRRWTIDGRPKIVVFDGVEVTMTIEDEKGKAPINRMDSGQIRQLFAAHPAQIRHRALGHDPDFVRIARARGNEGGAGFFAVNEAAAVGLP